MAIPMTVEGHQGKFKNSKGASRQTMHLKVHRQLPKLTSHHQ